MLRSNYEPRRSWRRRWASRHELEVCASCEARIPGRGAPFCRECLERARDWEDLDELGTGD